VRGTIADCIDIGQSGAAKFIHFDSVTAGRTGTCDRTDGRDDANAGNHHIGG
jgi:hypothetical protein